MECRAPACHTRRMFADLDDRLNFARTAARDAGELILRHYQSVDLAVESKTDESPVTVADRGAEQLLREQIGKHYPQDAIFGEEFGETSGTSGDRWILDPIDGTKAFVAGVPLFGTMIGLERNGECVLGVVHFSALNETVFACRGGGTWWQIGETAPRRTQARQTAQLADAVLCFTDVDCWVKTDRLSQFEALCRSSRIARGWGDCYGHCLVATGRADAMLDPLLNPWDAAALLPIVAESGATFVDFTGQPTIHGGNGLSAAPSLVSELLALVSTVKKSGA